MKIAFIAILVLLTTTALTLNIKADCSDGFSGPYTITRTYNYGISFQCVVNIVYCCKWDNNLKTVVKEITEYYSYKSNCLSAIPNWPDFLNWLHSEVSRAADNICTPSYPPCTDLNNPFYLVTVSSALCNYYENINLYLGDDVYSLKVKRCSTGSCTTKWEVCIDYSVNPPETKWTFVEYINGIGNCPLTKPTLPPQGKTWDEPWTTSCFLVECGG